ncbi:AbrB family transcriptional regulator [Chachezhania sediminis]|uniref:AbrB family transcriptional regulator n=1 Tax=Chachezhania sediminis TaxID=2599291 RepID=UPI00131B3E0E|nr:AbrB family transcriptional regulator [Chachezhania sediminis]
MRSFRIAGEEIHPLMLVTVFGAGIAGGFAAKWLGLPIPMLLGSVVAVGAISIFGFRLEGHPPKVPFWLRMFFIPIIGLSIGSAFTPKILDELRTWWPSLLAIFVYIPVAHYVGYRGFRLVGRLSKVTAYYSAVPGGLIECIQMGEENGADVPMLTALQFLRLILTIVLVPLAFSLAQGGAVGSAAGAAMPLPGAPFTPTEAFWQLVVGVAGFFLGRKLKLPAYLITGPILASGAAHLTGLLESAPPRYLISVTQLIIGVALGTRFVGMRPSMFFTALTLAFMNVIFTMVLAIGAGLLLHQLVDERVEAVVLAFAPGGLAEMSLVALSLHISVIYVTSHHVVRIVLSVAVAKLFARTIPPGDMRPPA